MGEWRTRLVVTVVVRVRTKARKKRVAEI